eukprot:GHRR01012259.1.p1 GENE.GHRR01012259.1~~GHRR01012259.1.p1  ORF type:complete len:109 (+),score=33.92 GHRR01012259.1:1683-2009(+)
MQHQVHHDEHARQRGLSRMHQLYKSLQYMYRWCIMVFCRQLLESVEVCAAQKQERLEAELHSHKTNLIKESIRLGHNDLGDFFYNRGDLQVYFGLCLVCCCDPTSLNW